MKLKIAVKKYCFEFKLKKNYINFNNRNRKYVDPNLRKIQ